MNGTLKNSAKKKTRDAQAFSVHESRLKLGMTKKLEQHTKQLSHTKTNRQKFILSQLSQALSGTGTASLSYDYEAVVPLSEQYKEIAFYEALVRLRDNEGTLISPDELFNALDNKENHLGMTFRTWLIAAQIQNFYQNYNETDRLSLNINPGKMNYKSLSRDFATTLKLAKANGHNIILEALEKSPWCAKKSATLNKLALNFCAAIAVDDFGDDNGHHTAATLLIFNSTACPLFIKIDGQIIRDFLDNNNEKLINKLREIKKTAPHVPVIAEYIHSAHDAQSLRQRLKSYGLNNSINLVQGRDIKDTPAGFLEKLANVPFSA